MAAKAVTALIINDIIAIFLSVIISIQQLDPPRLFRAISFVILNTT